MNNKLLLALALAIAAVTAEADTLRDELVVCRDLPDDARLICYDAAVDRSRDGSDGRASPAPAATPTASARAAPMASAASTAAAAAAAAAAPGDGTASPSSQQSSSISQEDLFGKDSDEVQRTVEEATGNERLESLDAMISGLQRSGYDKVVITLDNGQVWRQVDSSSLRLRVGDAIEIERAALGSFMLQKKGSKRTMRVAREQ